MSRGRALIILVVIVQAFAMVSPARADTERALIARAIARRICYEEFWTNDTSFFFGTDVPIKFKFSNGRGYAWSDNIRQDEGYPRMTPVFAIGIQGQQSLVTRYYFGFNQKQPDEFRIFSK